MSLLPSPIPHPLDYSPWELPGWVHEALDWVVGVEWPEGNERAVWDLADQWYGVAEALAGPHGDAVAAAGEVRGGYGGIGAVAEAFDAAWRRVADGDEAPLPVLLAVSGDIGRLVEECGCDIEGAKLEVWIELGILVVELLSLAVATVLTAGAASPAAGAAIAASRYVVQQIFKRLLAQLARKTLKQGLKEAGERAAKRVAEGGVRGLARRAARGGLEEAAEEGGITLATQAYQNSTGRRNGLDLADAGMSALGGLAGGAAAPLAGLGRHATGRFSRVGEHLGREMTGEMIADQAAALATGQGPISLEDAARAAASGATGSATGQADAALQHRLDGRMAALAGTSFAPADLGGALPATQAGDAGPWAPQPGPDRQPGPAVLSGGNDSGPAPGGAGPAEARGPGTGPDLAPSRQGVDTGQPTLQPSTVAETHVTAAPVMPAEVTAAAPVVSAEATGGGVTAQPVAGEGSASVRAGADPTLSSVATADAPQPEARGATPAPPSTVGGPAVGGTVPHAGPPLTPPPALPPTPMPTPPAVLTPAMTGSGSPALVPSPSGPNAGGPSTPTEADAPRPPAPPQFPPPETPTGGRHRAPEPTDPHRPTNPVPGRIPRPRRPEWPDAAQRADREAYDRYRYESRFRQQRAWYESNRRQGKAHELWSQADFLRRRAGESAVTASRLEREGRGHLATPWRAMVTADLRASQETRELGGEVLAGTVVPNYVEVSNLHDFYLINTDDPTLVLPVVETGGPSGLTGDDDPPPIDRSRRYGQWGGLRPPLALHQTDLEGAMPRDASGRVLRTADPRRGDWFGLANDGGPAADPTRGINCLDCTLSLYETWVHGRPRVSAPRTFDAYAAGDIDRPFGGEIDGPGRVEDITGGRFQQLAVADPDAPPDESWSTVNRGFGSLEGQLRAGGHGSYAFLVTTYEGGGSHAWVALNQNGGVLYLDPQRGTVSDMPIYTHSGWPAPHNVTGIDALILGPDGHPMPLAGARPGRFSQRDGVTTEEPPEERPDEPSDDELYVNRLHLLEGPGSAAPAAWEPEAPGRRGDTAAPGPADIVATGADLDQILAAGVTPVELVGHLDPPTLRRLVPHLDDAEARDVASLFEDHRVRRMLDETWREPPPGESRLAETLVKQLAGAPSLARIILTTPELAKSLTARPVTLHHLASHQRAIEVLESVVREIDEGVLDVDAPRVAPTPQPTPLTPRQREISAGVAAEEAGKVKQPGFDKTRRTDAAYRSAYLDGLYEAAAVAQEELVVLAKGLAYDGDREVGRAGWRTQPKSRQRAEDKTRKYDGNPSRLLDLAAAKVEFHSLEHLYDALDRLRNDPVVRIVRFEDRFQTPEKGGYRDVQMVLRASNGHLAEFRLHLAALDEVAVWEHALYEVRRDVEAVARQEGRELTIREQAIVDNILRRQQQLFWDALVTTLRDDHE
ncbi:toxin glutamine deamidase domain-containing protein [Micromonospora okii]|uniref:toxin glutamine deamidase domain-containing protein n=1 Tax=Micromonospora okii TaxID=1182970 RepID=UPI001E32BA0B|nr:toxin glutamine deamidase domain-containing protein [Micromonospora okii]